MSTPVVEVQIPMSPFELFVREEAQNKPGQSLQTTLNLWNAKNGLEPDFDNDPIAWAMSVAGVVDDMRMGLRIAVVKKLRIAGGLGLLEAKNLMEDVEKAMGLTRRYY